MIDSKQVDLDKEKSSAIYSWWIETPMSDWLHKVRMFFWKPYNQLRKLIQWQINVFHNDFDFDAHSVFAILEYKLKRVEKSLVNGCAVQEDADMKALRLAIKLAGRLFEDKYDSIVFDRIENKWGELTHWTTPDEDRKGYFEWHTTRANFKTPADEVQERKETKEGMLVAYNKMKREERWLYDILHKYMRRWWD